MAITATKPRKNAQKTTNSFWWADLQAKDVAAATAFYGATLGWEFQQETDPETGGMVYHTAQLGGLKLAGVGELPKMAAEAGMPSTWTPYVTVTDADAIAAKATELGGKVVMPAMDVMDQGRMAIIADPTGAMFGIWQNGVHDGTDAVNQPATLTWTELYSTDLDAAMPFYEGLFGWTTEPFGEGYHLFCLADGRQFAGLMKKPTEMADVPDCWVTYFGVADVEAAAREVKSAGGTVIWGPMQTGPGRSIGVQDPQGAVCTYMQLDEWPTD